MSENNSYKQILRSSSIIGGASVVNILIGLLRIKLVAVLLGPVGVGLLGILQNVISAGAAISALGFGTVGTRQIAEAHGSGSLKGVEDARRALFWGTVILSIIGGVAFFALKGVIALNILGDASLSNTVGWLALAVSLTVAGGSQNALLNGMRRIGDLARITIFSAIFNTILGIGILYIWGESGLIAFLLIGPFCTLIFGHIYVARLPAITSRSMPLAELNWHWRRMARLGSFFMIAGLVTLLGQLAVRSIVQNQLGSVELGYFQAAWTLSMTYIGFVLAAMGTDYYPRLTAVIKNHEDTNVLINEQTEVAILLGGPVLLAMLGLAPWVMKTLYSSEFIEAATILRWHVLGDVLKIASWPLGFLILASGDGKLLVLTETTVVAVFVIITWFALPFYGLEATGFSFLCMYAVHLPMLYFLAKKRTNFCWAKRVKVQMWVLVLALFGVFVVGFVSELGAMISGLVAATAFGIVSVSQLMARADISGPIGKIIQSIKLKMLKS